MYRVITASPQNARTSVINFDFSSWPGAAYLPLIYSFHLNYLTLSTTRVFKSCFNALLSVSHHATSEPSSPSRPTQPHLLATAASPYISVRYVADTQGYTHRHRGPFSFSVSDITTRFDGIMHIPPPQHLSHDRAVQQGVLIARHAMYNFSSE